MEYFHVGKPIPMTIQYVFKFCISVSKCLKLKLGTIGFRIQKNIIFDLI